MQHAADQHKFEEEARRGCGPGCQLVTQRCECGLGRRLRVLERNVVGVDVQFRATWPWLDVHELLDSRIPYVACPKCDGDGCLVCRNLGFMECVPGRHAGVASR